MASIPGAVTTINGETVFMPDQLITLCPECRQAKLFTRDGAHYCYCCDDCIGGAINRCLAIGADVGLDGKVTLSPAWDIDRLGGLSPDADTPYTVETKP